MVAVARSSPHSADTGTPKGVAVTHRSAAAFVDAESRLFLRNAPLGPGDRVLAGLSVAFDASCEEMWLAWASGATLVPAPRSLVRTGTDLAPWIVERQITAISTVPTLAGMWPTTALDSVRLLIFGGEGLPYELAARLAIPGREVWNTYGPTEATVVTTAQRVLPNQPIRIGLPLDGWDTAIVSDQGEPVAEGEPGELVIGGVGLARYLDAAKDAAVYAPLTSLGWERAYRSGDRVSFDGTGLLFHGRIDDQVKIGGRRIELGEIDAAVAALPGVGAAATAVRSTEAGHKLLVAYIVPEGAKPDLKQWRARLRETLPAPMVPQMHCVDELPTRTSGKVDRDALPWPLEAAPSDTAQPSDSDEDATTAWVRERMAAVLGQAPQGDDDFFTVGGGSLAAAQLVVQLRHLSPHITVADIYDNPTVPQLTAYIVEHSGAIAPDAPAQLTRSQRHAVIQPVRWVTRARQALIHAVATGIRAVRWMALAAALVSVATWLGYPLWGMPSLAWPLVAGCVLLWWTPPGRILVAATIARLLTRRIHPGVYPRGGGVHLRVWAAEKFADASGVMSLAVAPWMTWYARLLGARLGKTVHLHSFPPVTGMLEVRSHASVEPETDLSGHWTDGTHFHVGKITIGARAKVGTRSTLLPGAVIKKGATVEPGSCVHGTVSAGSVRAGSPAQPHERRQPKDEAWPAQPAPTSRWWTLLYGVTAGIIAAYPWVAALPVAVWALYTTYDAATPVAAALQIVPWVPVAVIVTGVMLGVLIVFTTRLLSVGLREGTFPIHSRSGWQVWATERLLDQARTWLFPLYASVATPWWLRALGAQIGRGVEASTVLLIPCMTRVGDGAFLADDTLIASYQLSNGWIRVAQARVGKRAFLGNSGMAAAGRKVPKDGLVAVLSAAPAKSKKGTSWLGSPPEKLRRASADVDASRTYAPSRRLVVLRGLIEVCRTLPVMVSALLALGVVTAAAQATLIGTWGLAVTVTAVMLMVAAAVAAIVTVVAKWVLVGRVKEGEHPLWSPFVWLNELADSFTEVLVAPWFTGPYLGGMASVWWLRGMGASIGRGVWCETYWLPEADLVRLEDGASVNRGCVVQTHLFHDRILSLAPVVVGSGGALGPHSVMLPAARLGVGTTVGPASLVLRGDHVPDATEWTGNPIRPWTSATVG